jgi:phosphate transport system substrate-binding protein
VATRFPASRRAGAAAAVMVAALAGTAACSSGSSGTTAASAQLVAGTPQSSPISLPSAPSAGSQTLSETGSTLLYPLFSTWAIAYHGQFGNVKITTGGTGSSAGIADAASGTTDVGASDAYLSAANLVSHPALENIPLVVSAQVISYNLPGVKGNLKLSAAVLAGMYQGTITSWNAPAISALNPGVPLPSLKIVPVRRSDGSGDTFLFTSYLSEPGSDWGQTIGFGTQVAWPAVAAEQAAKGNAGMVTSCAAHPGCTDQSSAAKAATIKALLNWILTQGSSATYLDRFGFQPLPSRVTDVADALIARIG